MSIPRRLCADTIRDFARWASRYESERARLLEAAEAYIRGEGLPEPRQSQQLEHVHDRRK